MNIFKKLCFVPSFPFALSVVSIGSCPLLGASGVSPDSPSLPRLSLLQPPHPQQGQIVQAATDQPSTCVCTYMYVYVHIPLYPEDWKFYIIISVSILFSPNTCPRANSSSLGVRLVKMGSELIKWYLWDI